MSSARVGLMSQPAEKVREAALELTEKERAELAYVLLQSLDGDLERDEGYVEAWDEELARRSAEVASGEVELVSWEDVKRDAREALAKRRQK